MSDRLSRQTLTSASSVEPRTIPLLITARRMGFSPCGYLRRYVTAVIVLLSIVSTATAKYGGGTGEPNNPYQIATAEDLILLGETPADYGKHFILVDDIDLDPKLPGCKVFDKAVIAPPSFMDAYPYLDGTPFTGVFDGNGHMVSHLRIEGSGYLGLFGELATGGVVKALGVVDVNITGSGRCVGGLVGSNGRPWDFPGGKVTQCYSTGSVVTESECAGGAGGVQ